MKRFVLILALFAGLIFSTVAVSPPVVDQDQGYSYVQLVVDHPAVIYNEPQALISFEDYFVMPIYGGVEKPVDSYYDLGMTAFVNISYGLICGSDRELACQTNRATYQTCYSRQPVTNRAEGMQCRRLDIGENRRDFKSLSNKANGKTVSRLDIGDNFPRCGAKH